MQFVAVAVAVVDSGFVDVVEVYDEAAVAVIVVETTDLIDLTIPNSLVLLAIHWPAIAVASVAATEQLVVVLGCWHCVVVAVVAVVAVAAVAAVAAVLVEEDGGDEVCLLAFQPKFLMSFVSSFCLLDQVHDYVEG